MARLALLLPAVALVAVAWAGLSGDRSDPATAEIPGQTAIAAPSRTAEESSPAQALGLDVKRLDAVQPQELGRDDEIAVAGWYVPMAISDCPPLAAIYRDASLPEVRGDADEWAFCVRSGVLYASRPGLDMRPPPRHLGDDRSRTDGLSEVEVTIVVGVIVPRDLETVGSDATQVVVIGRLVKSGDGCEAPAGCRRELVVDHVAWTPGA